MPESAFVNYSGQACPSSHLSTGTMDTLGKKVVFVVYVDKKVTVVKWINEQMARHYGQFILIISLTFYITGGKAGYTTTAFPI